MKKSVIFGIIIGILVIIGISYFIIFQNSSPPEKTDIETDTSPSETNELLNDIESPNENNLLQIACKNAVNDYPEWTKYETDIIIWEDSDKGFRFRNSPEDTSIGIGSPAQDSEILLDMDFVDVNEISYIKTQDNKWKIGLFKLNGLDAPTNSIIYENVEIVPRVDISPISKSKFIAFYIKENKAFLKYLDLTSSREEILLEIPSVNTNIQKISVSPKGDYVYFFYDQTLRIFEIASKTKLDEINSVESVVWVGELYLLYSNSEGTFIYSVENKEKNKLENMGSVSDLSFNPKEGGIITYNSESKGEVVNCQNWAKLNSLNNGKIETLSSEKTAIIEKEGVKMYWRFKNADWTLAPSSLQISKYVTVWKRY